MSMTQVLKNKKGVAVELSLITLVLTFLICSSITTVCMLLKTNDTKLFAKKAGMAYIDSIGEDFCFAVQTNRLSEFKEKDYRTDDYPGLTVEVAKEDGAVSLFVINGASSLTVEIRVETDDGVRTSTVTKWSYRK